MYTTDFAKFFGYGLRVKIIENPDGVFDPRADIALKGVEANENFLWGANLDGPKVFIEDSTFNRNVSIQLASLTTPV